VLKRHGGLVEARSDSLLVLLPEALSHSLGLPEEARLGRDGEALSYGTPLLDRFVRLATENVSVAYGKVKVSYIKKEGFDVRLSEDLSFVNARVRLVNRAETRTTYMKLACHYVALSDERKEGLVHVCVHEETGALIPDLARYLGDYEVEYFPPGNAPPHFPQCPENAVHAGLKGARVAVEADLAEFLKSMYRHLHRDVKNTREYYQALDREMRESLKTQRPTPEQRREREEKIRELPREVARKTEDLREKYHVQVKLTACTALRLLVPVAQLFTELQHRAFKRRLPITYNPVTRKLDPLVCESCGRTTRRVFPCVEGSHVPLKCESCTTKP